MATQMLCNRCGSVGKPKRRTRGSILIEIVLWICFIVPGVIYSIWRLTTRESVCSKCGSAELLPLDTPAAQARLSRPN